MNRWCPIAACWLVTFTVTAQDAPPLPPELRLNGRAVTQAFEPVIAAARQATVTVYGDGRAVALGTVASADGWVLTKASQLEGVESIGLTLHDGRSFRARVHCVDDEADLALLRIAAERLAAAQWSSAAIPELGRWVATPVPGEPFVLIGMTSATPRPIESEGGVMGVELDTRPRPRWNGVPIQQVQPDSGALAAGLRPGDVITHIADVETESPPKLVVTVSRHRPGQSVRVTYLRDGQVEHADVVLGYRSIVFSDRIFDRNEPVNGETSLRKDGFAMAIQHHIPLAASLCGGPLIDAHGRIIGMNIARANRSETYALPASLIHQILPRMIRQASDAENSSE